MIKLINILEAGAEGEAGYFECLVGSIGGEGKGRYIGEREVGERVSSKKAFSTRVR